MHWVPGAEPADDPDMPNLVEADTSDSSTEEESDLPGLVEAESSSSEEEDEKDVDGEADKASIMYVCV
jgi:hypothetical protein